MKNKTILSEKARRALHAFITIMISDMELEFEIFSFSCTGNSRGIKNETACRIICGDYQCDCLWHRGFEDNFILALALIVYAKMKNWGTCGDKYNMWKVTRI